MGCDCVASRCRRETRLLAFCCLILGWRSTDAKTPLVIPAYCLLSDGIIFMGLYGRPKRPTLELGDSTHPASADMENPLSHLAEGERSRRHDGRNGYVSVDHVRYASWSLCLPLAKCGSWPALGEMTLRARGLPPSKVYGAACMCTSYAERTLCHPHTIAPPLTALAPSQENCRDELTEGRPCTPPPRACSCAPSWPARKRAFPWRSGPPTRSRPGDAGAVESHEIQWTAWAETHPFGLFHIDKVSVPARCTSRQPHRQVWPGHPRQMCSLTRACSGCTTVASDVVCSFQGV